MDKKKVTLGIIEKVSSAFDIPGEVVGGLPRVTVTVGQVNIENHRGLLSYGTDEIAVNSSVGAVRITGEEIELTAMTDTELAARGKIRGVEFGG